MQSTHFNVGDVCVDRSKYDRNKNLAVQQVQIRRFNDDGSKAIVNFVHCSAWVSAIDVSVLHIVDDGVFLRPSPFYTPCQSDKKHAADDAGDAVEGNKRIRVEGTD